MTIVRRTLDLKNPRNLADEERADLARLDRIDDEATDYTDTPELDDTFWQARGHFDAHPRSPDNPQPVRDYKFEIFKERDGEYAVRFLFDGQIILQTLAFSSIEQAQKADDTMKAHGQYTPTETIV